MFYRLNERYKLVGWLNLPACMVDTEKHTVVPFPRDEYALLLHMNGQENMDEDALNEKQKNRIRDFLKQKMISGSETPFPESGNAHYQYYNHIYKKSAQWSITGSCNYRCRHCLLCAPENHEADLTTEQCLEIIRQIAECGIHEVALTGGEPLLRDDLPQLIRACSENGIRITDLQTNGALLTRETIEIFTSMGHFPTVQVSYDGVGWHDWVRGIPGAQSVAEEALRNAHQAGLKTIAAMCLFSDNVPVARETVRRLAALGTDAVKISPMLKKGLWGEKYADKTLTDEQFLMAALETLPGFVADGKPCELMFGGYLDYEPQKDLFTSSQAQDPRRVSPLYSCPWIAENMYISSNGTVLPCMELAGGEEFGGFPNILKTPLSEILRDSIYIKTVRTKITDVYEQNDLCSQCPEKGKRCGISCRAAAKPGFCGIDYSTCNFIRNGWYNRVRDAVEKLGEKYALL